MSGEITLNVADDEGTTMEFDSLGELAKLLKLAGVEKHEESPEHGVETDANGAFDVEVGDDGTICLPTDENADYDYGANPTSRKGYAYDIDPYKYQGDAEIPIRYTPARMADNPLLRFHETRSFASYLQEVEAK